MKLIRWVNGNKPSTGIILNDEYVDTSSFGEDYNETFFEKDGIDRLQKFVESNQDRLPKLSKDIQQEWLVRQQPGMIAFRW